MATMLIAQNETMESGSFMGDQLCSLKAAYLFAEHTPGIDRIIMSVSRANSMHFLWTRFIERFNVALVHDDWNPGDWSSRWAAWDQWRTERRIRLDSGEYASIDVYRELYLRIHGTQRQTLLCGSERGLGRRCIYGYWWCGQEGCPDELPPEVDFFDDTFIHHPQRQSIYDVWVSPHAKTQGNLTFTFGFWEEVVRKLIDAGITVTVGYNAPFCDDLLNNPLYRKVWPDHRGWMEEICRHRLVACGNTGTGWLACACGVPMITMEPPNSQMPDHRYRECGLRNIVEVVDSPDAAYVARRIEEEVRRKVVLTTGCYDVLHAGHVRHLERSRAMGTRLVVALNSDQSVKLLKGPERPINPEGQRKAVLEALRCVDEVVLFDGPHAVDLIEKIKPDVLTAGYGYEVQDIVGGQSVVSRGGRVVVTCQGDARDEPSTTKIVRRLRAADVLEICRQGSQHSVNPVEKLKLMADHFMTVKDLPGDVADLGAYRGGTSLILRRLAPEKHLHIFDTWTGTPYDDPLCHHKKGEWAAPLEDCRALVGEGDGYNTLYIKGTFPERTDGIYCCTYCFVYLDMDTEQATRDALAFFWPRMVPGGKIVVDDVGWEPCAGVKKALDESGIPEANRHLIQSLYTCVIEKR